MILMIWRNKNSLESFMVARPSIYLLTFYTAGTDYYV